MAIPKNLKNPRIGENHLVDNILGTNNLKRSLKSINQIKSANVYTTNTNL